MQENRTDKSIDKTTTNTVNVLNNNKSIIKLDADELKLKSSLTSTDELEITINIKNEMLKYSICSNSCLHNFSDKTISSSELICLRTCTGKLNEVEKVIEKFLTTKSNH